MSTSIRFIKNSTTYLLANLINAAIPFLLLPFLTTHLTPADYGILAVFQVLSTAVMPLITLNLDASLSRYYFESDKPGLQLLLSNGVAMTFLTSVLTVFVFLIFGDLISSVSELPLKWLWIVVVFSIFQKIFEIPLALWRVQHQALKYGIYRILKTLLEIGLSVIIVLAIDQTWQGRVTAQVVAAVLFGLYGLYYILRLTGWKITATKKEFSTLLRYGAPLIPHELGAFIIAYSDRLFIINMVGAEATGLYSVGYQIGMAIGLIQNSFNQAWTPWFFETLLKGKASDKLVIVKIIYIYYAGMLMLVVGLIVCLPLLFKFIGRDFAEASQFVLFIGLGFAFNGMYKIVVNFLFFVKKTYIIGGITVFIAILNVALNYFFIRWYGTIGAAYSTTIAFFVQFVITWITCIRAYDMPWLLKPK